MVKRRDEARARLEAATTFEAVADEVIAKAAKEGKTPDESGKWTPDAIERALAHADSRGFAPPTIAARTGRSG
jgi:hypothetical protein